MKQEVIVIGAGGHGKVVADIVLSCGDTLLGFLDDSREAGESICGIPVLGKLCDHVRYPNARFVVGIGGAQTRRKIAQALEGVQWYTAIHPSAVISRLDTRIGEGTVVMAGAIVNPCSTIGKHCILNTGCSIDHDNRIGDYTHISVGAHLAGTVTVGEEVWVGIGATVSNNLSLCDRCFIGAGAVVVHPITEVGTYVGIPVRKIK